MNQMNTLRWTFAGGVAALAIIGSSAAMAQSMVFPPGTDCSLLPQGQQTDCRMQQQQDSTTQPGAEAPLPAGNGTGTNSSGTLTPNVGSGQTNGSTLGTGGANGSANPPGQSGN